MKRQILLLTILSLSISSLFANSYSWTGYYLKLNAGYSNLKLNYSGNRPFEMQISIAREPSFGSSYSGGYRNYNIAEKVSAHGAILECAWGLSQEISENFGLIGECGGTFGGASKFLNSTDAFITQGHLAAGIFYHQPSFRLFTMGGVGLSRGVFGYPNAVETLQNGHTITVNQHGDLLNSSVGITYRGSVGVDYKINSILLLGISYNYTRSVNNVALKDEFQQETGESFYISNHSFAAMIGLHI